ncbi:MotA/TolQ/ExbB proton channel family protein [Desulfotignum balticum]|jgi:biopolymer transport protein ExbB/TolQ|uniref:MotA/TolQ/ExbB proton channel family protein n=1 Tax=Desulfotignum balticum TaxID=115781 RepID=UPI0003F80463|nr:MotA/TolQ/ExbB proton channel family protein [Desulfotignum balticum]
MMQILAVLKTFIYLVSSSIFLPVLLLLSLLVIYMLVYTGHFFRLWIYRRRLHSGNPDLPSAVISGQIQACLPEHVVSVISRLSELDDPHRQVRVVNLLRDNEHALWQSLDRLKLIIRIGPGLGLIGTLIPMGTGLAALGQGDLTQLGQDLVVAFTTTVVGMSLGLLAYVFFTVQRRWVEQDIKAVELAAELLCSPNPRYPAVLDREAARP